MYIKDSKVVRSKPKSITLPDGTTICGFLPDSLLATAGYYRYSAPAFDRETQKLGGYVLNGIIMTRAVVDLTPEEIAMNEDKTVATELNVLAQTFLQEIGPLLNHLINNGSVNIDHPKLAKLKEARIRYNELKP